MGLYVIKEITMIDKEIRKEYRLYKALEELKKVSKEWELQTLDGLLHVKGYFQQGEGI